MPLMSSTLDVSRLSGWLNADAVSYVERNMPYMCMTLVVSRLSGWLNADADCQESNGGHTVRGEGAGLEAGGRRVTAVHAARRGEGSIAVSGFTGRSARRTWRA